MRSLAALKHGKRGLYFCLFFAVWLGIMAMAFEWLRPQFAGFYMYPISYVAVQLLNLAGVDARLGETLLAAGVCELAVRDIVYLVTFECTGIFALFMCLAAVLAYPASVVHRIKGVVLAVPAFIVYSTLRLLVMGMVARFAPAQIELFHVYIMVLVNIGFVMLVWMYWLKEVVLSARGERD